MIDSFYIDYKLRVRAERLDNLDKKITNSFMFDSIYLSYKSTSILRNERLTNFDKEFPNSIMFDPI